MKKISWLANIFLQRNCYFLPMTRGNAKMKLKDAAAVRSGLVLARKQAKDGGQYQYPLITLRALREDGTLITQSGDTYCTEEPLRPEYLSQPGDIVMRLTVPYTAVLIGEDTAGMVISSNFAVIRCREGAAVPAYLHWLLNTESMRRRFYKDSAGNMLSAVSPRVLAGMEIHLPALEAQRQAAGLYELARREAALLRTLAEEKMTYCEAILTHMYQKGDVHHDNGK
jgi:type I restriction modification DNA specificity domain